jgi:hypothetical protein
MGMFCPAAAAAAAAGREDPGLGGLRQSSVVMSTAWAPGRAVRVVTASRRRGGVASTCRLLLSRLLACVPVSGLGDWVGG